MKKLYIIILFLQVMSLTFSQDFTLPLWEATIPNQKTSNEKETVRKTDFVWIENVQIPTISVFLPAPRNSNGIAVVIFPGGGYVGLAYDWEGIEFAKGLNSKGISAIVVKSRLPISKSLINPSEVPLQDAQRAIRLTRLNAQKWGINPDKIGVMGFSAGGHLASTLCVRYDVSNTKVHDSIDDVSARPDFAALIYPVITFKEPWAEKGTKHSLIGENPDPKQVEYYSNELHVTANTPPTFLAHASDDKGVVVENSLLYYKALVEANVSVEMHIFPKGGHGFGLGLNDPHLNTWVDILNRWILDINKK